MLLVFSLIQCQKEESEVIDETQSPENLIPNSPLAKLVARMVQSPTGSDNILDGTGNLRIVLPVEITLNSAVIHLYSASDYQLVYDAKNASTTDDDIVHYHFPITVQYKNYTTQVISNQYQLDNAIDSCGEDDGFDEIDCITLNYPITINIYNTNNQVANTVTLQNNLQFYSFISGLTSSTVAAIVYPISGLDSNGQNVVINSNAELESFIENAIDDCDDDIGGGSGSQSFTDTLTSGTWDVSYCKYDNHDYTYQYDGYVFTFYGNGTIHVVKGSNHSYGTWSYEPDDDESKLVLHLDSESLEYLEEDWKISEYNATTIRLRHGGGDSDYLYFAKN